MDKREVAEDLYRLGKYEFLMVEQWDNGKLQHLDLSGFLNVALKYTDVDYNRQPYLWNKLFEVKEIVIGLLLKEDKEYNEV